MISIEGELEHITFYNRENNYTVAKLRTHHTRKRITIVGHLPDPAPGECLTVSGDWESHPRFGAQFRIDAYEVVSPKSVDSIEAYLSSGIVTGVGPKLAAKLVSRYGEDTLDVIASHPEKLGDIPGIGADTAERIGSSLKQHHHLQDAMRFLQDHRIPAAYGAQLIKTWGDETVDTLRRDPYRAAKDIPGIGFARADALALRLGIEETDPTRIQACLRHLMEQAASEGHIYLPQHRLTEDCRALMQIESFPAEAAVADLVAAGELVRETAVDGQQYEDIFLRDAYLSEKGTAERIRALLSIQADPMPIDPEQIISEVVQKLAINPSPEQLDVLQGILSQKVAILTGGPGTGKTTLLRSICAVLASFGKGILLAAPTGRAARRLEDVTQRKASTIHKLLGYNLAEGRFDKGQDNPLDADTIIIDEASMLDSGLLFHLLKAMPLTANLILVGDLYQLPSVGPGNTLADLIRSGMIPTHELTTIYRQAQESPIVMNAHRVRSGEHPDLERVIGLEDRSEFNFIEQNSPEKAVELIVGLCASEIPQAYGYSSVEEIQVLCPMHKGAVGTINLNRRLQKALNENGSGVSHGSSLFKLGDKVMHLVNNYQKDVFNGDIGIICEIDDANARLTVDYAGWFVEYEYDDLSELSLAYAISVHKSQGSEYPVVVIPIMMQHAALLQRNLLYTGMTRGRHLVVFVGTRHALDTALSNNTPQHRLTRLTERLKGLR